MNGEPHPFARVNLGHVLTILTMMGGFWLFSMKQQEQSLSTVSAVENRLTKIETNVEWIKVAFDRHLSQTQNH